jgi:EmrB/QacA subfamily drug resistance transporter
MLARMHPRATLAATILGSSLAFIDGSVVNVALPALALNLKVSASNLPWVINAYLLPVGALTLLGGALGDHMGRRRLFHFGLATFTLASAACAAAPSLGWLLAARGLQGLGAAVLLPNSLAILSGAFTGEARGRAIGTWAAVGALAGALGPIVGGWIVDTVGWRTIFLINLPIAAAAGYFSWNYVEELKESIRAVPLDTAGAALATVALGLLTWSLTDASESSGGHAGAWLAALAGCVLLGVFLWLEGKLNDRAIMPLSMFGAPTFVGLNLLTFFIYGSLGGLIVLLPFFLIRIGGWPAIAAGASLLPVPALIGFGSRLMGRVSARHGERRPLIVGASLIAIGLGLYARVGADGIEYWRDIFPPTILVAIGMTACVAPLTTSIMTSVDATRVGLASGFNSAVARIAGLIATALLGFVFARQGSAQSFLIGFRWASLIGAASAALAAASAALLIDSKAERPPRI